MPEVAPTLLPATELAPTLALRTAPNGLRYALFGDLRIPEPDFERFVQAIPAALTPALAGRVFYFVPLALAEPESTSPRRAAHPGATLIAPVYTPELSEEAICHRNVPLPDSTSAPSHEGTFISVRLLRDPFALAFELYINAGHAVADSAGIPEPFATLAWNQALASVRGETSQDAHESRADALADRAHIDEKARNEFLAAAFADSVAIYLLSLALDFDYSELREREYPLLTATALAERLRLIARLFPPNPGFDFAIKYRRRA